MLGQDCPEQGPPPNGTLPQRKPVDCVCTSAVEYSLRHQIQRKYQQSRITVDPMLQIWNQAMYFSNAFTGQTEWCDRLRNRSTPKQNGSVLDSSMCSRYPLLSIVRWERKSVRSLSKWLGLGAVYFEHRRKPNKTVVNAAQYIRRLSVDKSSRSFRAHFSSPMILIVIGRRGLGDSRSLRRLMPRSTRGRRMEVAMGSGRPAS